MDVQTGELENGILNVLVERDVIPNRKGWALVSAHGGLNSRVYFARSPEGQLALTLRLSNEERELLRREADILTVIGTRPACAPRLITLIDDIRIDNWLMLVHDYVAGSTAPLHTVSDARLRSLGQCLAAVHSDQRDYYEIWPELEPLRGSREQAFRDRIEAITRYETFSTGLQDVVQPIYHQMKALPLPMNGGWQETAFSLLQGDLSAGNIVWNGDSVTLIDWEYARYGDPAEDLAYVLAEQPLPPDAISTLHESYVNSGGDLTAIERALHYAPLASLDSVLWWGDYHLSSGMDPTTAPEVSMHLDRTVIALRRIM